MKIMLADDAKNGFGMMNATAGAELVLIEKHRRDVVEVVSAEEYERLSVRSERTDQVTSGTKGAPKGDQ